MNGIPPVDFLANQLASYFGDASDDSAIALLKGDMRGDPALERALREGFERVLSDPDFDCRRLVEECANRVARTDEEGRAWLSRLRKDLFDS